MPEQPQVVQPQPVPQTFVVQVINTPDAAMLVALQVMSPTGSHVSFLSADDALALAAQIEQAATHARTGLIVAGAMPNGNGS